MCYQRGATANTVSTCVPTRRSGGLTGQDRRDEADDGSSGPVIGRCWVNLAGECSVSVHSTRARA